MDISYVGTLNMSMDLIAWYSAIVILFSVMLSYEKSRGLLIKIKIVPQLINKSTNKVKISTAHIRHLKNHVKRVHCTLQKLNKKILYRKISHYSFAQLAKKLTKRLCLLQKKALQHTKSVVVSSSSLSNGSSYLQNFCFSFSLFKYDNKTKSTTRVINTRVSLFII